MRAAAVALALVAAACQAPAPEPDPSPTVHGPRVETPYPCDVLDEERVSEIVGQDVTEVDAAVGDVLGICTYELPDGIGVVDIAVVDLPALAAKDELVTPNEYIDPLRDGAGQGHVEDLVGVGSGDAITIAYQLGSQAWAWEGMLVVGAYATEVLDPTDLAVRLLEAALEAL